MKARILAIALLALGATSCITMTIATMATTTAAAAAYALATSCTRLKGQTIKQIDEKAALLETKSQGTVCIVYPFEAYQDGQKISGRFRRGGVYQYTDDNGETRQVPIYVYSKNLNELVDTAIKLDARYRQAEQAPIYQA
ncbi:MAG: hypothetical protein J5669_03185 [Bacteroidales bacterium]|nr:hypothetical protein [Bacteroidales bacterium]